MEAFSFVNFLNARPSRAIVGVALCAVALLIAALCGGFNRTSDRRVQGADVLSGKWSSDLAWNSASGRVYSHTMHTAFFFLPGGVAGTVMTFPAGAIGGVGTYTLKDSHLTLHCTGMSVSGHPIPMALFANKPWFHETVTYSAAFDGKNLTLSPTAYGPAAAPCYPLLVTSKPLVVSRVEKPVEQNAEPAPKE
jgi:hypothetical protein